MLPQHLASLVLFFSLLPHVLSISRNITIDDSLGDPATGTFIQYHPPDAWNDGRDCNACTAHPSESMLFRRTWTDSTFNRNPGSNSFPNTVLSASVIFNGTAVYVQCALARTRSSPTGDSDMTFLIDGQIAGAFVRDAPGEDGYDYNVTVFSKTDLSPGFHSLVLLNGHVNGTKALVLLDSIIYTQDDGEPLIQPNSSSTTSPTTTTTATPTSLNNSASTSINASVILASVFGTLVLIILCVLAFLLHKRKRKPPHLNATPFVMPSMAEFSPRSTEDSWTSVYPEASTHRSSIYTFSNGRSTRSESSYPAPRRMSALYTIHSHVSANLRNSGGNDRPPAPTGRPSKFSSVSNGVFITSDEGNPHLTPAYGEASSNLPGRS